MTPVSKVPASAVAISVTALMFNAVTAEVRQHGSHEHGAASLNVAIVEQTLAIEFIAPAANIVGFEHTPRTQAQKQAVSEAEAMLESDAIFSFPPAAECTLSQAVMEDEHEEHGEHEEHAEHEQGEAAHSEFHAEYEYQCRQIERLTHVDVRLFEHFPGNEEIAVQVITPNGQGGAVLTSANARIELP